MPVISFNLDQDVIDDLTAEAKKQERTVSKTANMILKEGLKN